MLIDTHAHLDFLPKRRKIEDVLVGAKEAGVGKIITIGTSIETSKKAIEMVEKYSTEDLKIYATCGIHPQDGKGDIEKYGDKYIVELRKIAESSDKIVAIGECGLDYYEQETGNNKLETTQKKKEYQRKLFKAQIELASKLNLPAVVHCRNAWDEIFDLIKQGPSLFGVFHCWTGDWKAAKAALELGFYISFSGIVTFKNASVVQDCAKKAPLNKIILETDSPFLSPEPLRGKQNEPKNVRITAEFLASIREENLDKIEVQTTANATALFL